MAHVIADESKSPKAMMRRRPVASSPLLHNVAHSNSIGLFTAALITVAVAPGAAIGAALTFTGWRVNRPSNLMRCLVAGMGLLMAAALHGRLALAWDWYALLHSFVSAVPSPAPSTIVASLPVEAALGPAVLSVALLGRSYWEQSVTGQELLRARDMARQKKALERGWQGPTEASAVAGLTASHPPGGLTLGTSVVSRQPFVLSLAELAQHVFVPGNPGTGKTTTLVRLADGALANGYGVVIVDCKGSGLGGSARRLAAQHSVPLTIVDPLDEQTVGYDPCTGDASAVANKLIGAFSFSGDAEIYKQVAMEAVPVVCRALLACGEPVTLEAIYDTFNKGGLGHLGRKDGAAQYRARLDQLDQASSLAAAGYVGLQKRLGALMEGRFGDLFRQRPALDWMSLMERPSLAYLSLSATAAGEDVELFGRVILQDLKQVCDARMRAIDRGANTVPFLLIFDEFAALREAQQIVDLLLQARQARTPLVVATQFIPEEPSIRRPVMGAGVLIVHRVEAEDAEPLAAQFGTRSDMKFTAQIDMDEGDSRKGSMREVEEYIVHPNDIRRMPVGTAAVLSRVTNRHDTVFVAQSLK